MFSSKPGDDGIPSSAADVKWRTMLWLGASRASRRMEIAGFDHQPAVTPPNTSSYLQLKRSSPKALTYPSTTQLYWVRHRAVS